MAKKTVPRAEVTLSQLREVIGDRYLAKRPSFKRAAARALDRGGIVLERADYDCLMVAVRSMKSVERELMIDTSIFSPRKVVANRWDAEKQIKTTYERIEESPFKALKPAVQKKIKVSSRKSNGSDVAFLCCPDVHFGWRDNGEGALTPIHDEAAVACFLEVAKRSQPEHIILLGDLLDLASLGKYPCAPELLGCVQPALQAAYDFIHALRQSCPRATISYIEGNHECRLQKMLSVAANEVLTIKRVGDKHKAMSIEHLLRLDELEVQYIGPYGADLWKSDFRFMHGSIIGKNGGDTVAKLLRAFPECSTISGHTHRLECAWRTITTGDGPRFIFSLNCGTLARLDGVVPGSNYPDWKQGFGVIRSNGSPQVFSIENGEVYFDGSVIGADELMN